MSGFGQIFFELGIFGLVYLYVLYSALYKSTKNIKETIFIGLYIFILMSTAIPLTFPILGFIYGLIIYQISINIKRLTNTVNTDKAKHLIRNNRKINLKYATKQRGTKLEIGDIIHRNGNKYEVKFFNTELKEGDRIERKGEFLEDVKYPCRKIVDLNIGDIVERKLKNGDIVLLNRQPTLHNASMQAMEIVKMPYKTFRFNLSIAKPFNADFNTSESNREH